MYVPQEQNIDATGLRLGVVVSRYHGDITEVLCEGAVEAFLAAGGRRDDLLIVPTAGAFELTAVCRALARRDDLHGLLALGCVIRGETAHDEYICHSIVQGLTSITLETGTPVGFGLLTCHTKHQARERAGGSHGNKGQEALAAVVETIGTLGRLADAEGSR